MPSFRRSFLILAGVLVFAGTVPTPACAVGVGLLPRLPTPVDEVARPVLAETRGALDDARGRINALVRANPRELARDPRGELVLRGELVAVAPTPEAVRRLSDAGYRVRSRRTLDTLDMTILVLEVPQGQTLRRALRAARKLDPAGRYDYNHVYLGSGVAEHAVPAMEPAVAPPSGALVAVGMVDGGVDPTLDGIDPRRLRRHGCATPLPDPHGTAVAAALLAEPRVRVHAADIYCGEPTGGAVSQLAEALAWLADENVTVINLSLVGPPNLLLEAVVASMQARGHVLVAAVGNEGPAAPPRYPSAYPGVIGVAALDTRGRLLPESARGPHVDVAALGLFQGPDGRKTTWRGTSFAAPRVSRRLAITVGPADRDAIDRAEQALRRAVEASGKRGRDPRVGWGRLPPDALDAPVD